MKLFLEWGFRFGTITNYYSANSVSTLASYTEENNQGFILEIFFRFTYFTSVSQISLPCYYNEAEGYSDF